MRAEIIYSSKIIGESPSDYDYTKLSDKNEVQFLKHMDILQGITTRLKYNIEIYEYFLKEYLLNNVVQKNFIVFFTLTLINLSTMICNDFSCILFERNDLNIDSLKFFCKNNSRLFRNKTIEYTLKETREITKKAKKLYNQFFHNPRSKIFAHIDKILLEDKQVEEYMDNVRISNMKKLLSYIKKILNIIWYAYNGHKLCFTLKNGKDYKKLIKSACAQFGDSKFILSCE